MDVGILGLDTSHAETFGERLAARDDVTVAAAWDGGDVRDAAEVESFCDRYGATRYDDPDGMVDAVDAAMVLAVNWDAHAALATPFLDDGVPTFVDKPVAGRVSDVELVADAAASAPLFGGSSIPFAPQLDALPRGQPGRTLFAAGYNDPFYYGVHAVDTVRALAGADWTAVEPADGPGVSVAVDFEDGTGATLRLDGPSDDPAFGFLDVADRTRTAAVEQGEGDETRETRFVDAFLATARGERDDAERVLDAAVLQLAVHAALDAGDRVTPESETLETYHEDGSAFADYYAEKWG